MEALAVSLSKVPQWTILSTGKLQMIAKCLQLPSHLFQGTAFTLSIWKDNEQTA